MDPLLKRKKVSKGKITRLSNIVESLTAAQNVNIHEVANYYEQACNLWSDVNKLMDDILSICNDDEFETYQMELSDLIDKLDIMKISLKSKSKFVNETSLMSETPKQVMAVNLPKIDLPSFNGSFQDWLSFHDLFIATVHNQEVLSKAQKLQYLKLSLKGEAATLIQAFQITDENYDTAWKILCKRYENKTEIIYAYLDKLFNQPPLHHESAFGLRKLLDTISECLYTLTTLKQPVEHWDCIIMYFIRKKLDPETLRQWEMSQVNDELRSLEEFKTFLDTRARALGTLGINKPKQEMSKPTKGYVPNKMFSTAHYASYKSPCVICNGEHSIYSCNEFLAISVSQRRDLVKRHRLCFNCLRNGHFCNECKSGACQKCKLHHHTLLHVDKGVEQIQAGCETSSSSHCIKSILFSSNVLLPTALIKIRDKNGNLQPCRALIDSGSQSSFVREDCVQRLGLKRRHVNVSVAGLSTTGVGIAKGAVHLEISSFTDPDAELKIEALILSKLTCDLPQQCLEISHLKSFKHLKLADPSCTQRGAIDVLLGADVFSEIMLGNRFPSQGGSIAAHETVFGWIISGKSDKPVVDKGSVASHYATSDIDSLLHKFWELDEIPASNFLTSEEQSCENHFLNHHFRNEEGSFVVRLPFRDSALELGASEEYAIQRLHQIERRFARQPEIFKLYKKFMEEYLSLEHMEIIPPEEIDQPANQVYYLPHHAVINRDKPQSKFRVVFDASAKSSSGVSLNDKLMIGPTLQDGIICLLLRFGLHQIGMSADIVKMYRQIQIHPKDTDYQRIVWRDSVEKPIETYRLKTVTYGTASAPYLAVKCLQQLGKDEAELFPLASQVIQRDFYVDDLMTGTDTVEEALQLQQEVIQILRKGGFEIKKWASSENEILKAVPQEMREKTIKLKTDCDECVKALGIHWCPTSDNFAFKVTVASDIKMTKRSILSTISKVFDPIGWLSPVTINFKILMQRLWKLQLNWDDDVPLIIQNEWCSLCEDLLRVESIRIPRCIVAFQAVETELHGFSDASEKAYAAAVYLRSVSADGTIKVQLVASKTKVAPLKTVSLPRLELCAALLLAKLIVFVHKTLDINSCEIHCWTDSTIVLSWLRSCPSRWKTFVANRVATIQNLVSPNYWHHVRSENNSADCASRGITACTLQNFSLWWVGPDLLHQPNIIYTNISNVDYPSDLPEERANLACNISTAEAHLSDIRNELLTALLIRFSNLSKLKRVLAYCLRCINNFKYPQNRITGYLSTHELENALYHLVRSVQCNEFAKEVKCLQRKETLSCKSSILSLNPFLDDKGILRVGGRLHHSNLSPDKKHPILLPKRHKLTDLIVAHAHISNLHAGPQLMLAVIQRKFWIISARDVVRRFAKKCITCFRYQTSISQQMMGDLPSTRVMPTRAFLQCGVDYAGPFMLRASRGRGRKSFKAYLALFVCFVTRAIHLELVGDLSTASFIAALKRFIARRGKCQKIYSDCGSNFKGAQRELKEIRLFLQSSTHNDQVAHFLSDEGIDWHFNPPASPHMGGIWEAGVKSVKYHLKRIVGNVRMSYEEMYTVIVQIEACLNSRPLCPISSDPNDLSALTPGHFLIGSPLTAIPEGDFTSIAEGRLNRWQLMQRFVQHFWKRWSAEYLVRLQQRPKWMTKKKNIEIDQLVLLKEDHLPPLKWRLGRIVELFPGSDGCVRVVGVKTIEGVFKRNVVKICQLPVG